MRIIAGGLKGRTIEAPRGAETRPTLARVREALFQILGPLEGARVLDLYAGSGALGLEAVSRGAARVVHVESGRAALAALRGNVARLGTADASVVVPQPVERARAAILPHGPFDLVLADPPWALAGRAAETLARVTRGLLKPGARVVIGHAARTPLRLAEGSGLTPTDDRAWGDSALAFFAPAA